MYELKLDHNAKKTNSMFRKNFRFHATLHFFELNLKFSKLQLNNAIGLIVYED